MKVLEWILISNLWMATGNGFDPVLHGSPLLTNNAHQQGGLRKADRFVVFGFGLGCCSTGGCLSEDMPVWDLGSVDVLLLAGVRNWPPHLCHSD